MLNDASSEASQKSIVAIAIVLSGDVRQEIEEALLLPMAEIERRKKGLHEIKPFSFWAF